MLRQAQRKQEAAERRAEGLEARVEELEGELDDAMQRCEVMQEQHDDDAAAAAAPSSPKSMEEAEIQLLPAAEDGKRQGQDTTAELESEV